ncbi:hypothetical protein MNV49_002796 [Pseudohyphozyma bogoriensis]|nr:hypothetical protein MNV49_002796 [Pseudohyphozyma bogoriensis]
MYGGGPPPNWQGPGGLPPPPHLAYQNNHLPHNYHQSPPHFNQGPPHGHRAGLGAPGAPQHLPPPPNLQHSPSPGPAGSPGAYGGDKFPLFVGAIADGVETGWLERVLGTAGPVLSLKRPSPPFAFVEYGDPESVIRALEVVHGTTLVGKTGAEKAITLKADEKTTARLNEYKATRVKSEQTDEYALQVRGDLESIVKLMRRGDAPSTSTLSSDAPGQPTQQGRDRHLQDLAPEDLPENSREVITSEIALFRERAAKKAAEKKEYEALMEQARRNQSQGGNRQQGGQRGQQGGNNWGPRGGQNQQQQQVDPQSYNKPIGFVAAGGPQAGGSQDEVKRDANNVPVFDDEERERDRLARDRREAEAMFRDVSRCFKMERRLENRERGRISNFEREKGRERAMLDSEDRERVMMRERLATWDDEKEADRGREAFYVDRQRWRGQRRPFRARELDADLRDRQTELAQAAALQKQSDDFFASQSDLLSKLGKEGGAIARAGPDEAVKLSFGGGAPKPAAKPVVAPRPAVLGTADDEDEGKKKRALIPLTYDDEIEPVVPGQRLSQAEKERKAREIFERIPSAKESLWTYKMAWGSLSESIIKYKLTPLATKTIVAHLGSEEDELLSAVVDHVRAHKPASELVEELEPVLDEEATEFVRTIWKGLAYELALAAAGLHKLFTSSELIVFFNRFGSVWMSAFALWWRYRSSPNGALEQAVGAVGDISTPFDQLALLSAYELLAANFWWKALGKLPLYVFLAGGRSSSGALRADRRPRSTTVTLLIASAYLPTLVLGVLNFGRKLSTHECVAAGAIALGLWAYLSPPADRLSLWDDDLLFYESAIGGAFVIAHIYVNDLARKLRHQIFGLSGDERTRLPQLLTINFFATAFGLAGVIYDALYGDLHTSLELFLNTGSLFWSVTALNIAFFATQLLQLHPENAPPTSSIPSISIFTNAAAFHHFVDVGSWGWCGVGWVAGGLWIGQYEVERVDEGEKKAMHLKRDSNIPTTASFDQAASGFAHHPSSSRQHSLTTRHYTLAFLLPVMFSLALRFTVPSFTSPGLRFQSSPTGSSTPVLSLVERPPLPLSHGVPIEGGDWESTFHTAIEPNCTNETPVRWPGLRRTGLVSHPRSGNTFVRELVERSTGFQTSTAGYCDGALKTTFLGECDNRANLLIKTHFPDKLWKSRGLPIDRRPGPPVSAINAPAPHKFDQVVHLVDALYSGYHFGHAPKREDGELDHTARLEIVALGSTPSERHDLMTAARTWAFHDS